MTPRKELLRLGRRGRTVRVVEALNHGDRVYLVTYTVDGRRRSAFYPRPSGKAEALAFAEGVAHEQGKAVAPPPPALTLEQLYARYAADIFPALRPRTKVLYAQFWAHFANFAGPHVLASTVGIETLTGLRTHLETKPDPLGINSLRQVFATVRMVFRWGEHHQLVTNRVVTDYRLRVAKEDRPTSPDEFRQEELLAILATLRPHRGTDWRPWVALTLCGYQGARQNAVLHLRWEDVDLETGTLTWRAEWDKLGREWTQPLRAASRAALQVAAGRRKGRAWVLPGFGRGADAPYTISALWVALRRSEERAGIVHRPGRGGHGFRRLLAGEVNTLTGNAKLALEAIGDTDLKMARKYLKPRQDQVREAFADLDSASRTQAESEATDPPKGNA